MRTNCEGDRRWHSLDASSFNWPQRWGPRSRGAAGLERRPPAGTSSATSIPKASRPAIPIRAASSSGHGGRSKIRGPGPRERSRPAGTCSRSKLPRTRRSGGSSQQRPRRSQRNRTGRRACWSVVSTLRASTGTASPTKKETAAASAGRSPRRQRTIPGRSRSLSSAARAPR